MFRNNLRDRSFLPGSLGSVDDYVPTVPNGCWPSDYAIWLAPHTYIQTYTRWFNGCLSRWTWISLFPHDFLSPYNPINTIPLATMSFTEWMAVKEAEWRESTSAFHESNWCRNFEAGCPFYRQPVLKTSTGSHSFFIHLQTLEGRDIAAFYICSQMSVLITWTILLLFTVNIWLSLLIPKADTYLSILLG